MDSASSHCSLGGTPSSNCRDPGVCSYCLLRLGLDPAGSAPASEGETARATATASLIYRTILSGRGCCRNSAITSCCDSDVSGRSRRPGRPPRGGRRAGAGVGWSGEVIVVHQAAGLGQGLAAGLLRQAQGELGVLQQREEGEALLAVDDHSIAVG